MFAITWRATTQFVPLRLMATIRASTSDASSNPARSQAR
jgi:hypothetical protein